MVGHTIRLPASNLRSAVPPDLRVRPAWPAPEAPPVVCKARDVSRRHPGAFGPDVESLVVGRMDRHAQAVRRHLETAGYQLPCQRDRSLLEIRARRCEVAKHLEEGVVAISPPNLVDVAGAQAFLAAREPGRGRLAKALVEGLKRLHSGRDEERARIPARHQRRAGQDQMLPAREML